MFLLAGRLQARAHRARQEQHGLATAVEHGMTSIKHRRFVMSSAHHHEAIEGIVACECRHKFVHPARLQGVRTTRHMCGLG